MKRGIVRANASPNIKEKFILAIGVIGLIAGLIWIIILFTGNIDIKVSNFFASHQSALGIEIMRIITSIGSNFSLGIIIIGLTLALYFSGRKKESVFYFLIVIGGLGLEFLLKEIIKKPRPINPFEMNFSFPSGHTFMIFIIVSALAYLFWPKYKKIIYLLFGAAGLVAFTRIYLNVHWLSDIFGSIALASAWLIMWIRIFNIKKPLCFTPH